MRIDPNKKTTYHYDRSLPANVPVRLTAGDAQRKIREIAANSDHIIIVDHGRKRAAQRSITRRQIERCLQKGTIQEGPFLNEKGNWQATIYRHAAGETRTCVVAIDWPNRIIVITTWQ